MEADAAGTRVHFECEAKMPGLMKPLVKRQFRGYHANLRREVEAAAGA
jgi:hypothetical protein